MADVKWIKVMVNVFNHRKIEQIEVMPDGDGIIVVWFKLLCLAGNINNDGYIYFTDEIPYTDEMLAVQFRRPLALIRLSLTVFTQFRMIEIIENIIHISNWDKYQNVEGMERVREQTRKRVANHRKNQNLTDGFDCNVTCNATVTQCNATEEERRNKKEEVEVDRRKHIYKRLCKDDVSSKESSVSVIDSIDNTINTNTTSNSAFDVFWNLYPKKIGKGAALKKWQTIKPDKALIAKIMNAVREQMTTAQWTKEGGQYIPNPTTWLNQGRWDDKTEINIETTTATPAGKCVRAQQYDQRVYAETELSGMGNVLSIADVLKDLEVLKGEGGK